MISITASQWQEDDIRDYIDFLEKAPGKDKFICPLCNGNDLSIGENGFTCYSNNCDLKQIYEVVKRKAGAWVEHPESHQSHKPHTKPKTNRAKISKPKLKHKSVSISQDNLTLAKFPSIPTDIPQPSKPDWIPQWLEEKLSKSSTLDTLKKITYHYSKTTWLDRYQWLDKLQKKGTDKSFLWGYRNPETGDIKRRKLEQVNPYRFNEVLEYASGKCFLAVEGEKSIEACRSIGLVASDISQLSKSQQCLVSVKENDTIIIIIPDKDQTGLDKAIALEKTCLEHQIKYLRIDVEQLWRDKPDKYDIADFISEPKMNAEEILQVLNSQIQEAIGKRLVDKSVDNAASHDIPQDSPVETTQIVDIQVTQPNKAELVAFVEKEYGDCLKYNLRTQEVEMRNVSVDMSVIDMELAKVHRLECKQDNASRAFQYVAIKNEYDPVRS